MEIKVFWCFIEFLDWFVCWFWECFLDNFVECDIIFVGVELILVDKKKWLCRVKLDLLLFKSVICYFLRVWSVLMCGCLLL